MVVMQEVGLSKPHGCGLWKGIMSNKDVFEGKLMFKVGKGSRVRFWEDRWCLD